MQIEINSTTEALLRMLKEREASEPPFPDSDKYVGSQLEAVARRWNEWESGVRGIRGLVAVRLRNEALEALDEG